MHSNYPPRAAPKRARRRPAPAVLNYKVVLPNIVD